MKTYSAKPKEVERKWYLFDASSMNLGRLSTLIARYLVGKSKPMYTPHIDCGDYAVVVNSDKLQVTGNKKSKKIYYSHSGYPGSIKVTTLQEKLDKDSTKVIYDAVKGMLPDNKLRSQRLNRLKIYSGDRHDHTAQTPQEVKPKGAK